MISAAVHAFETEWFARITSRLPDATLPRLDSLLGGPAAAQGEGESPSDPDLSAFSRLKGDAGRVALASVEREIERFTRIEQIGLPADLLTDMVPGVVNRYRRRAATESAWQMRRHPPPIRNALLATFCWQRRREITDGLVDLLVQIVHRMSVRAEKTVKTELVGELEKVQGKESLLFRLAEAALGNPDGVFDLDMSTRLPIKTRAVA